MRGTMNALMSYECVDLTLLGTISFVLESVPLTTTQLVHIDDFGLTDVEEACNLMLLSSSSNILYSKEQIVIKK